MLLSKPKRSGITITLLAITGLITLVSWSVPLTTGVLSKFFNLTDTIPQNAPTKITELDEAILQLEKATQTLKERDIATEIADAVKEINLEDIHRSVNDAMTQAKSALDKVDARKVKEQVTAALAEIDKEKIEEQVKIATARLQPQLQKSLEEAKRELKQAKQELESAKQKISKEKI